MVFSSTVFLFIFLPAVLLIYYSPLCKSRTAKNVFLLISSLIFYGYGEPLFVLLLILSVFITWYLGLRLSRTGQKKYIVIGTVYHIAVLAVFKYLTFLSGQLGLLIKKDLSFINIALPIGISFFTFQLMSYLFDVYYQKAKAQRNPLYVGLYVALFPQLIAGPIVRYEDVVNDIDNRIETVEGVTEGVERFVFGLAKKVLVANYMAALADVIIDFGGAKSVLTAWLGAIAYTLQIYFDFSGYSDMAIGLGRCFGFKFLENFNYPYTASTITDFWRRWHISLSTWFRDYVYIPLGGNRVSKGRWIRNLFIVWLLTGIWHGANWTFVAWGLLYFVLLLLEKLTGLSGKKNVLTHLYTAVAVIVLWVIFRSESIFAAGSYIGAMFGIGADGFIDSGFVTYIKNSWLMVIIAIFGVTPVVKKGLDKLRASRFSFALGIITLVLFVLSIMKVVSSAYNPFIYFNF